jgi:group I intron endonuclease
MNLTPVAVYKIVNTVNGKLYIGQSVDPYKRLVRHFSNSSGCTKLKRAIQLYGKNSFRLDIIHWCDDKKDANELETFLIEESESINKGYNITPGGYGTGAGKQNPFYGKSHSLEFKLRHSNLMKGRVVSKETREKLRIAGSNRIMSEVTKEKLRARPKSEYCSQQTAMSNKLRIWTDASKDKLRAHNLGKTASDEAKRKISIANSTRVWSSNSKLKVSQSKWKPVFCKELNVTFISYTHAASYFNVNPTYIGAIVRNNKKLKGVYTLSKVIK